MWRCYNERMDKYTYIIVTSSLVEHGINTIPTILKISSPLQLMEDDMIDYLTDHCGFNAEHDRVQIMLVQDIPTMTSVDNGVLL